MKDFIVKEYKVTTSDFTALVTADKMPMVSKKDSSRNPPSLWGGAGDRPVMINQNGELKTRQAVEEIFETEAYYALIDQGFRKIKAFAEVDASPIEDLEVYRGSHSGRQTVIAEFTPCCEDREYTEVLEEDDVVSWGAKILVPHEKISDDQYIAFVTLRVTMATYKVLITVKNNRR